MNKVILMGRLTRDPEYSQTPSGVTMARFSIAVNRRFAKEGQQQADFINCTAWRQQAEFICKYFKKGSMIAVIGSIQTRSWDGQDGKKQYATDVVVDEVYFTGSKNESGTAGASGGFNGGYSQPAPKPEIPEPDPFGSDMDFMSMDNGADDDLPF
jgi:single-strand DNA-binding protein